MLQRSRVRSDAEDAEDGPEEIEYDLTKDRSRPDATNNEALNDSEFDDVIDLTIPHPRGRSHRITDGTASDAAEAAGHRRRGHHGQQRRRRHYHSHHGHQEDDDSDGLAQRFEDALRFGRRRRCTRYNAEAEQHRHHDRPHDGYHTPGYHGEECDERGRTRRVFALPHWHRSQSRTYTSRHHYTGKSMRFARRPLYMEAFDKHETRENGRPSRFRHGCGHPHLYRSWDEIVRHRGGLHHLHHHYHGGLFRHYPHWHSHVLGEEKASSPGHPILFRS